MRATGSLQFPCVASAEITPEKISDWTAAKKLLTIPNDALLLWGYVHVITAFDDSGALTMDVGHGGDPNFFTTVGLPIDLKTAAVTALDAAAAEGVQYPSTTEVQANFPAGNGDSAVGKAVIYLAYVRPNSAHGVN